MNDIERKFDNAKAACTFLKSLVKLLGQEVSVSAEVRIKRNYKENTVKVGNLYGIIGMQAHVYHHSYYETPTDKQKKGLQWDIITVREKDIQNIYVVFSFD